MSNRSASVRLSPLQPSANLTGRCKRPSSALALDATFQSCDGWPPMRTTLYLLRHAATAANLAHPAILQGCRLDPPLAPLGVRQAMATRDFLAVRPVDACYTSPLIRARE